MGSALTWIHPLFRNKIFAQNEYVVILFLQNNCSKWLNRFGTNIQKTELVSEQAFCCFKTRAAYIDLVFVGNNLN